MKKCIYQKKYGESKIQCEHTGTIRWKCALKTCKYFCPTLRYRLFGKWWEELR